MMSYVVTYCPSLSEGFAKQRVARAVPPTDISNSTTSACLLASGTHVTPKGTTKKQRRRQRLSSESSDGAPVPLLPSLDQETEAAVLPVSISLGKLKRTPTPNKSRIERKRSKSSSDNDHLMVSIPRKYCKSLQVVPTLELQLEPVSAAAATPPEGYSIADTLSAKKKKKKKAFVEDVGQYCSIRTYPILKQYHRHPVVQSMCTCIYTALFYGVNAYMCVMCM